MTLLFVGAGGLFSAIARYALDGWVARATGGGFPWGTLVVNVTGSFALGVTIAAGLLDVALGLGVGRYA